MPRSTYPAAIILAAGISSRMGQPKLSLPFRGGTFLEHLAQTYRNLGVKRIIAVVSDTSITAGPTLAGVEVLHNPRPEEGPLSSMKIAIGILPPRWPGYFLHPVDHPAVAEGTLLDMINAWGVNPYKAIKPVFEGRGGHPLLMGRGWSHLIQSLPEASTLRDLLQSHSGNVLALPVADPGTLLNVNDPAQYKRLLKLYPEA